MRRARGRRRSASWPSSWPATGSGWASPGAGSADAGLTLAERRALRDALGPWRPLDEGPPTAGHLRRYALHRRCVLRVLSLWEAARPADRLPHARLALADDVMAGRADPHAALEAGADDVRALADLYADGAVAMAPQAAGLAAVQLVVAACTPDHGDAFPRSLADADLDPEDVLPDLWACVAAETVVEPATGEERPDLDRRREFWRWYVDEALPAAARVAED